MSRPTWGPRMIMRANLMQSRKTQKATLCMSILFTTATSSPPMKWADSIPSAWDSHELSSDKPALNDLIVGRMFCRSFWRVTASLRNLTNRSFNLRSSFSRSSDDSLSQLSTIDWAMVDICLNRASMQLASQSMFCNTITHLPYQIDNSNFTLMILHWLYETISIYLVYSQMEMWSNNNHNNRIYIAPAGRITVQ